MAAVEDFILLGVGLAVIGLRMYLRIIAVGWRDIKPDDYLIVLAGLVYCGLSTSTYIGLDKYGGLSNDGMTDEQRETLDPRSKEYTLRASGAKLEIVSRVLYATVLWLTKGSMLAFYRRLTERFGQYETRIRVGYAILVVTWLADLLITLLSCRPFRANWQINPDPGGTCHPATSPYSLFGTLSFNIITSLYVFFVPLPILWMANIEMWKKLGLILLVSAECFVIAVAILRGYLITATPMSGARQASRWAYRVSFVAIVTTNLPLFFPLLWRFVALMVTVKPHVRHIKTITTFERTRLTGRGHGDHRLAGTQNTFTNSSGSCPSDQLGMGDLGVDLESVLSTDGRYRRSTVVSIQEDRIGPWVEESFWRTTAAYHHVCAHIRRESSNVSGYNET
ncbi:uncharacterized protein F4822DRAFT_434926 [Hypoxylon trugodes]|uniref:uncharacterized protein n=1 Tax=Hypoxylon trugodes TaxID=326681 RepID=UPI0021919E30|nr:uncharacterized protein F4822DRAFT_434926 [Hypoxylon trugodes]KAI1382999.1 hypothetical protein F4822DRAFT_434926 [Hypoxylon trugodes]